MSDVIRLANHVDRHIGARIRERRIALGMNQEQLGKAVDRTYQQQQKYETAANRVSASVLWEIAQALGTPIEWFFEGLGGGAPQEMPERAKACLQISKLFAGIENQAHQQALINLARALVTKPLADEQDNQPLTT